MTRQLSSEWTHTCFDLGQVRAVLENEGRRGIAFRVGSAMGPVAWVRTWAPSMMDCLSYLLFNVTKHRAQREVGKERVNFSLQLQSIVMENQDKAGPSLLDPKFDL